MKECKIIHINDSCPQTLTNGNFHFMEEFPWAEKQLNSYLNQGYEVKQMIPDLTPGAGKEGGFPFYKTGFIVYLERETDEILKNCGTYDASFIDFEAADARMSDSDLFNPDDPSVKNLEKYFDRLVPSNPGLKEWQMRDAEEILHFHFPESFRNLYLALDGFHGQIGDYTYLFQDMNEILNTYEYDDMANRHFVFFGRDTNPNYIYAMEKSTGKIGCFFVEDDDRFDIDEAIFVVNDIEELFQHWKEEAE